MAHANSSLPYLRHLNLHHLPLFVLLFLASFPFTMATIKNNIHTNPGDSITGVTITYRFAPPTPDSEEHQNNNGYNELSVENYKQYCGAEFECQCPPSACECPLTIEPESFKQLKENLGPVIRQRLRELLKKALTVESAIEAAHTIDLLKLLNESNSELNKIRDNVQKGAQQLRDAFHRIPELM